MDRVLEELPNSTDADADDASCGRVEVVADSSRRGQVEEDTVQRSWTLDHQEEEVLHSSSLDLQVLPHRAACLLVYHHREEVARH